MMYGGYKSFRAADEIQCEKILRVELHSIWFYRERTLTVYYGIWLSSILLREIILASTVFNFLMNKFYQNETASVLLQ